jgi:prepilin-type N-terminal cleavage/methylation domain-containing protein
MSTFKRTAFTLIELLVVIAIIGILSGLIVVSMSGITQKANIAKAQIFSNSLRNSLMANIVGEWKFDGTGVSDGGTATTDYTKNTWGSITCSVGGSLAVSSSCINGSCLNFDGSTTYLNCYNETNLQNISFLTISVWVNPTSFSTNKRNIICKSYQTSNSGYEFSTEIDGSLSFRINPTSSSYTYKNSAICLKINEWQFLTVAYDGINVYFYRNGVLVGSPVAATGALYPSSDNLIIGAYRSMTSYYFSGLMDEVRIYNAVMPISQIKEQYYLGLNSLLLSGQIGTEEYVEKINSIAINE